MIRFNHQDTGLAAPFWSLPSSLVMSEAYPSISGPAPEPETPDPQPANPRTSSAHQQANTNPSLPSPQALQPQPLPPVGWHELQPPQDLQPATPEPGPAHQEASISSRILRPRDQPCWDPAPHTRAWQSIHEVGLGSHLEQGPVPLTSMTTVVGPAVIEGSLQPT